MLAESIPDSVEVSETGGGVRYALPRRDAGPAGCVGLPLALFGAAFLAFSLLFAAVWLFMVAAAFGDPGAGGQVAAALGLMGLMMLPLAAAGAAAFGFGMSILAGNVVVEARDGELAVRTGWWRFRRSRRVDLAGVAGLAAVRAAGATAAAGVERRFRRFRRDRATGELRPFDPDADRRVVDDFLANSSLGRFLAPAVAHGAEAVFLLAEPRDGAPTVCLSGYPAEVVVPVARDLVARVGVPFEDRTAEPDDRPVSDDRPADDPADAGDRPAAPAFLASASPEPTSPEPASPEPAAAGVDFPVSTDPCANGSASSRDRDLVRPEPGVLVVRRTFPWTLVFLGFAGAGAFFGVLFCAVLGLPGWGAAWGDGKAWVGVLFPLPFLLVGGAGLSARPTRLDRNRGELRYG